ncbi:hypothetical protein EDD22DRAFT_1022498 [Suillus occidentalis]|nr:hypothetical protein EDD22DRAFT_1022498 [Suillus occidentalis]
MSSTAPTRQALSNILNHTDCAPSQRQQRERRPSEKVRYQVEEDQERREARQRPRGQDKTKATRKNHGDKGTHDGTQFSSQAITLSTKGSVPSNGPLDLRPRFSTVAPREKHRDTPRPKRITQVHTPAPSRTSVSGGSGGWFDDPLTKETGFINCDPPPAPRRLTKARANELIQLRRVQSTEDLNDGGQYDDIERNGNDDEDEDNDDAGPNNSDVFTSGDTYYDDYDAQRLLKRMRPPPSDDEGAQSHKRIRESSQSPQSPSPQQGEQRLPLKIHQSKGRVAARDYEVAVQQLIKYAISHFCVRLASKYAYPDRMTQVLWAKEAWKEACECYEMEMGYNGEIIQMITRRTSHLTSEVKGKVRPLVESIYGFESTNRESIKSRNRKLARQLKDKFGMCYRDLGDKKNNVPRSGLFRTRLNQQAANILWYRNKKDEGVVFEKAFSPFPLPALALVYTAAECCIDEWYEGEREDISFSSGEYREAYDRHLANLKKFDARTKDHGILDSILTELNNNGRLHAKVDPINVGDKDCLSDDEIHNAIREYQQVGGAEDSDEVESGLESEDIDEAE